MSSWIEEGWEEGVVCVRIQSIVTPGHSPGAVGSPVEWTMADVTVWKWVPFLGSCEFHHWKPVERDSVDNVSHRSVG